MKKIISTKGMELVRCNTNCKDPCVKFYRACALQLPLIMFAAERNATGLVNSLWAAGFTLDIDKNMNYKVVERAKA